MPFYNYRCDNCGHELEVEHGIHTEVLSKCPACKRRKLRRMISQLGGFVLKGEGWFKDGYGGKQ